MGQLGNVKDNLEILCTNLQDDIDAGQRKIKIFQQSAMSDHQKITKFENDIILLNNKIQEQSIQLSIAQNETVNAEALVAASEATVATAEANVIATEARTSEIKYSLSLSLSLSRFLICFLCIVELMHMGDEGEQKKSSKCII